MSTPHSHEDRFSRYLKALGSNYIAFVINISIYAITVPLLLHWLGAERYGLWLILLQLTSYLLFAITWIAAPVARAAAACFVNQDEQKTRQLFQTTFVYYAFCGLGVVGFTRVFSPFFLSFFRVPPQHHPDATVALELLSWYALGSMQLNLLCNLLTGFQRMHIANLLFGIPAALGTIFGIVALSMGLALTGLAAGHVVAVVFLYSLGWLAVRQIRGVTFGVTHSDSTLLWTLLRSGSSYLRYSLSYLLLQSDILLVGILLGPTAVTAYGIAYKLMDYLVQLIWKIPDSLFPTIAELDIRAGSTSLRAVHVLSGKLTSTVAFLFAVTLALYGHSILSLWLGAEHIVSPIVFAAFAVLVVVQALVHSSVAIAYGTNQMGAITRIALVEGGLKVLLAFVLLPQLGTLGVAVSTILAQSSLTLWYVPLTACTLTGDSLRAYFSQSILSVLPAAIGGSMLGGLLIVTTTHPWLQIGLGIPLSVAAYVATYFYYCLSPEEYRWMVERLQRVFRVQHVIGTSEVE